MHLLPTTARHSQSRGPALHATERIVAQCGGVSTRVMEPMCQRCDAPDLRCRLPIHTLGKCADDSTRALSAPHSTKVRPRRRRSTHTTRTLAYAPMDLAEHLNGILETHRVLALHKPLPLFGGSVGLAHTPASCVDFQRVKVVVHACAAGKGSSKPRSFRRGTPGTRTAAR